jgi:hypothetical protein
MNLQWENISLTAKTIKYYIYPSIMLSFLNNPLDSCNIKKTCIVRNIKKNYNAQLVRAIQRNMICKIFFSRTCIH